MATIPTDRNLMSPMGNLEIAVSIGAIPNWRAFRKFGMNDAVPSGTSEMWPAGELRVLPTSAGQFSIVSDSAEDDPDEATPPGTGAWTVTVEGLDSNYDEISETVTLAGLTPVLSVGTDWFRINRMYNVTAGSNEVNVGNITASIGGDTQAYIEANQGQTHQTHYTVPAGHSLMIRGYRLNVGRMSGSTDLHVLGQAKFFGTTAWRSLTDIWLWNGANWMTNEGATLIPEKTELRQRIISTTTTQSSSVTVGYLIKNAGQGNFG